MINQVYSVTPTKTRQVLFPSTITVGGVPLMLNDIPFTNLDAYQQTIGGATGYFDGCYTFEVSALSSISPEVGADIKVGDPIYAVGGTLDAATNVRSGFTLCADSSGILFGYYDPSNGSTLASGTTANVNVTLADEI